jgi:glyoxylase-like metal-dependent hydrolase (beta-lactamase superfamily II)
VFQGLKKMFTESYNNIFAIDTKMFGFKNYQSCYLIVSDEIVLVDAGIPSQLQTFYNALHSCGYSIQDVSRIIITHCEHPDHAGNAGAFVLENPNIKVYINPVGLEYLTVPSIERDERKKIMNPQTAARFGIQKPVPEENIFFLEDGEIIDIGSGQKLKIMFTPAHQPSGLVIFDEKNKGLFINDLIGNYFSDIDFNLILAPDRSDIFRTYEDMKKFQKMDIDRLYLGHYGIESNPQEVFNRTLNEIQRLIDIADNCLNKGKPQEIGKSVLNDSMRNIENLKHRSTELYEFTRDELLPYHSACFAGDYLKHKRKILRNN